MAETFYRAQVRLANDTGVERDAATNTFHFYGNGVGTPNEEMQDINVRLLDFYHAIDSNLSENIDGPACTIKMYDMADAIPRVPIYDEEFVVTPGSSALPNQVALVLRYRGAYVSGVARARRRGRLFIGPLGAVNEDGVGDATGETAAMTLVTAANALKGNWTGAISGSTLNWRQFSPTTFAAGGSVSLAMTPVIEVGVPNRFGVIRSRATAPTEIYSS